MGEWEPGIEQAPQESLESELEHVLEARRRRRIGALKAILGLGGLVTFGLLISTILSLNSSRLDGLDAGVQARVSITSMAAVDEEAWVELQDLETENDQVGLNLLQQSGRLFILGEGTRVEVLDTAIGGVQVRAMDGSNEGMVGWVHAGRLEPVL